MQQFGLKVPISGKRGKVEILSTHNVFVGNLQFSVFGAYFFDSRRLKCVAHYLMKCEFVNFIKLTFCCHCSVNEDRY